MKWINVKDSLPSENKEYLVLPKPNRDLNIITAVYEPWHSKWNQDFYNGYDYEDFEPLVTHWAKLPNPPEDG